MLIFDRYLKPEKHKDFDWTYYKQTEKVYKEKFSIKSFLPPGQKKFDTFGEKCFASDLVFKK